MVNKGSPVRTLSTFDGTREHRFELLAKIGQGTWANVYLALDVSRGRLVALKQLSPSASSRCPKAIARFEREARLLATCDHPNIARVLAYGRARGRPFYVMELCSGEPLDRMVAQGPVPILTALWIVHGIARALDYLSGRGIVHRDVKPSNVLVEFGAWARLADLGHALVFESDDARITHESVRIGTPAYMAPEQVTERDVDGRADVYSLGLVLAATLLGKLPGRTQGPIPHARRFELDIWPSLIVAGVPRDVVELCGRATRFDRDLRFASAGAFASALRSAFDSLRWGRSVRTLERAPSGATAIHERPVLPVETSTQQLELTGVGRGSSALEWQP